jgi:uncharacterized protein
VPPGYVDIAKNWADGDTVEVSMPFSLRTERFRDNPRRFAFMYGPLVLCAAVDAKLRPEVELKKPYPGVVAEDERWWTSLKRIEGRPATFAGPADVFRLPGEQSARGITLEPFHGMHGGRHYVVYWDGYTPAQWADAVKQHAKSTRPKESAPVATAGDKPTNE